VHVNEAQDKLFILKELSALLERLGNLEVKIDWFCELAHFVTKKDNC